MASETKKRNLKGSGSISYDEKRDRWIADLRWTDKSGKKHRQRFTGKKKVIVKNKLDEFKKQLAIEEGNVEAVNITFREYAGHWLEQSLKIQLKPSSYLRKEVTLENQVYPYLGDISIDKITHADVQNMISSLNDKGLSYSTIKKAYECVSGCMRDYRIKTMTSYNPCEGIKLPTNKQKEVSNITFFNADERKLITEESTRIYKSGMPVYRLGHSIVLLMYTGLRIGELLALKWTDVDFEKSA